MVSAFVGLLVLGQLPAADAKEAPIKSKELSAMTRPVIAPAGLLAKDIVSVSEYTFKDSPYTTRVYRYVFRGDLASVVKLLQSTRKEKDGWTLEKYEEPEVDLWRNLADGPVAVQGLLIKQTRLVKDPRSPTKWKALPWAEGKGWIWISYNEQIRSFGQ